MLRGMLRGCFRGVLRRPYFERKRIVIIKILKFCSGKSTMKWYSWFRRNVSHRPPYFTYRILGTPTQVSDNAPPVNALESDSELCLAESWGLIVPIGPNRSP